MSDKKQYFRVRNLGKYQHYKNRNPTWIKLQTSILSDVEFSEMKQTQQLNFIKLILLASQNDNRLGYQSGTIAGHICAPKRFDLGFYLDMGFIEIIDDTKESASDKIAPNIYKQYKQYTEYKQVKNKDLKTLSAGSEKPEPPGPEKFDQKSSFESVWETYPRKLGKKQAFRHYKASVKNIGDQLNLIQSMANYLKYADAMEYDYQHGSTWFNNWQDHIEPHQIKSQLTEFEKAVALRKERSEA